MRISDWSSDVCSSDLSFDLQRIGDDATAFKIFVSEVDLAAFPADVAERIRSDCATQAAAVDHRDFIRHIERFEARGVLDQTDADAFIEHFVERLMSRNGPDRKEHTSELQSLMRISYAVFCLKKKK